MSDPKDGVPRPTPADALTGPMGPFGTIEAHVAAARTLELHGSPSVAQTALGIARSKIGEREPDRRSRPNEGIIVDWSMEGLSSDPPGPANQWCAFFACQCVRRALIAANADAVTLRDWRRTYASGSCSRLWQRLEKHGLAIRHVSGQAPPEGAYFVFFANLGKQGEYLYHDDGRPDLKHVGIVDRAAGQLLKTVEGNATATADRVAEGTHMLDDVRIYGFGRLPYDTPGT